MKRFLLILAITLSLLATSASAADQTYGDITASRVIRVYDGDTFYVDIDDWPPIVGKKVGIRVYGIDTPDSRGTKGEEKERARTAKRFTEHMLKNKKVELKNIRRGKYFRIVADVYVDGKSLADLLIKNGLAKPYFGGKKQ